MTARIISLGDKYPLKQVYPFVFKRFKIKLLKQFNSLVIKQCAVKILLIYSLV